MASPTRWEEFVGWFANLVSLFPNSPVTTAASFVSEAIGWIAQRAVGDLPGLSALDSAGALVAELQSPPAPPAGAYSALVSNFHPDANIWQRIVDAGVDQFFGSANDLLVHSEGGWSVDRDGLAHVPAHRIGCFGPGGNLLPNQPRAVHHFSFFERAETASFIADALAGNPHNLALVDPFSPLPDRP